MRRSDTIRPHQFIISITLTDIRATKVRIEALELEQEHFPPNLWGDFDVAQRDIYSILNDEISGPSKDSTLETQIINHCSEILVTCKRVNGWIDCAEAISRCASGPCAGIENFGGST